MLKRLLMIFLQIWMYQKPVFRCMLDESNYPSFDRSLTFFPCEIRQFCITAG
jgi:hypothetical protein